MKFTATVENTELESKAGFLRRTTEEATLRTDGLRITVTGTPDTFHIGERYTVTVVREDKE